MSDPFASIDLMGTQQGGSLKKNGQSSHHDPFAQLSPLGGSPMHQQPQPFQSTLSPGGGSSGGFGNMPTQPQPMRGAMYNNAGNQFMSNSGISYGTNQFHSFSPNCGNPMNLQSNFNSFSPTNSGNTMNLPSNGNSSSMMGFGTTNNPMDNSFATPPPAPMPTMNKYILESKPNPALNNQVRMPEIVNSNLDAFSTNSSVVLSPSQYTFDPFSPSSSSTKEQQNGEKTTTNHVHEEDPFGGFSSSSNGSSNVQARLQSKRKTQESARMNLDISAYASMASSSSSNVPRKQQQQQEEQQDVLTKQQQQQQQQQVPSKQDFQNTLEDDFGFSSVSINHSSSSFQNASPPPDEFNGAAFRNPDDEAEGHHGNGSNEWGGKNTKLELQEPASDEYDCVFESGRKLGVLMEKNEIRYRNDRKKEQAVVKLVVENGSADRAKVTVGSIVVGINGCAVEDHTYNDILDMIKSAPRPMTIRFRQVQHEDDTTQGNILTRISNGTFSVGNLTSGNAIWDQKYFAFGGTHADVLQLFDSRAAYHECVIALYEKRVIHSVIQSFRLCRDHKVTPIKSKVYKGYGNLYYFALTVPSLHFTAAKFASDDQKTIRSIWTKACEAIDRKQREY